MTKETMERIRKEKKDFFFSGKKAVELGVADDVLQKPEKKYQLVQEEELEEQS